MLIDFKDLGKYGIVPTGVLHVGMHEGEEYETYKECKVKNVIFIEANEDLCKKITFPKSDMNIYLAHAVISDVSGEIIQFNITNNNASSSILPLKEHSEIYPHIHTVRTIKMKSNTLDDILSKVPDKSLFNIVNIDIQGAELKALKGLTYWENIHALFLEVNYAELYEGCPLVSDITEFLKLKGYYKAAEVDTGCKWGDALFVRNDFQRV